MTLLMMKLETIEHARFRAISQIIIDKDKGITAFEEYMKLAFPYLEATKAKDRESNIAVLKKWVGRGPFSVKPLQMPNLKSRIAAAKSRIAPPRQGGEQQLYKKMGRSI